MNKNFLNWKSIVFNLTEFIIIFGVGYSMNIPIIQMTAVITIFILTRSILGGAKHYKSPMQCMIWSTIVIAGLFSVIKTNFILAILITIFTAMILSGKGDIEQGLKDDIHQ